MKFEGKIEQPPKPKNVFEMETENAHYDIVFSHHQIPTSPKAVENADAIILEFVTDYHSKSSVGELMEDMMNDSAYKEILEKAQKEKKTVYFVDVSADFRYRSNMEQDLADKKSGLMVNEAMAGSTIFIASGMYYIAKNIVKEKPMSRRDFLKFGLAAGASAYLSSPIAGHMAKLNAMQPEPVEGSLSRKADKWLEEINYQIHPELRTTILDTRNDLIAQKAETIAKELGKEKGSKPSLAIVIGAAHSRIEKCLNDAPEERIGRIRDDLGAETKKQGAFLRIDFVSDEKGNPGYRARLYQDPAFK